MGIPNGVSPDPNGKWVKLITQLGIPTVLAGILLYFVLVRMLAIFDRITTEMAAQTQALQRIESQIPKR